MWFLSMLSSKSIAKLDGVEPILKKSVIEACNTSPFDYGIPNDGGLRTPERQKELYSIGRTTELDKKPVTWTLDSNHMAESDGFGHAVDLFAYVDKKASWDLKYLEPIVRHIQKYAKDNYDLVIDWGQDLWGKDGAHIQIK